MWSSDALLVAPEPRHNTPLGGLKRLGTVMNRRRSIVQPSSAGPFFSDKKHRSPFASFKRGDSRELQIPETPTEGMERPSTAMTTQDTEPPAISSESHEHEGFAGATSTAMPQSAPATANGATSHEAPSEEITAAAGVSRNEVSGKDYLSVIPEANLPTSHESTQKVSRSVRRPLTRLPGPKGRRPGKQFLSL